MYAVVIEFDAETGSYGATSPDIGDNVVGIGGSAEEAIERFRNALESYFIVLREDGKPIPQPRHMVAMISV